MIKAAKVIEALEAQIVRLKKFHDEDLASFVLIIPPVGSTISSLTMDDATDSATFFQTLSARFKVLLDESQQGGVNVHGYQRR